MADVNLNPAKMTDLKPDLLIQGGLLLSMQAGAEPLPDARILIQKDRILDILAPGQENPYPAAAETLDALNTLIMPGLINAHCHAAMTLFRGFADDLPLQEWLFHKIFPAEARYLNFDTVYWGTLLGCLEMIASGTTTFADGYFFQDATLRAVHEAGLRSLISQGVIDFPAPGVPDPAQNLKTGQDFLEKWIGFSDLITPGLFCHSPLTCSAKTLQGALEISRNFCLPLQIHLSETAAEVREVIKLKGKRPALYLSDLGLLDHPLIAAHAVHLDASEIALLAAKQTGIVHVPESNMKLSSGVAPVPDMLKQGLCVGIGTDGCASNNDLDLFREMDSAAKLHKVFNLDPVSMRAETVLQMATAWGARVLGLERQIGTIQKGKKADLIIMDLQSPHLVPLFNPYSTLVYAADGSDVRDVMVNGKFLLKNKAFQTLDAGEIMHQVAAISRTIKAEA
jgi:5-methylthioadenosine/S-adenosylhomocysteine deaminase